MINVKLGRLEKVDLRAAWESEAGAFTPWLAQEENLKILGDTVGIELELEAQEKGVGPFRADLLCKDTATDDWVLIENQLEKTDHVHLGQLITYAAGLNAVTIVWISGHFTEEHRAAIDWLNERTDEKINLFGLEIELWRIGESPMAPKFNIISQPNDWTRTVQQAAAAALAGEVTPHKQMQQQFWTQFKLFMETSKSFVKCQKPHPQHWLNHAIGRSGVLLSSIVSLWNSETNDKTPEIRAEVVLNSSKAKPEFAELMQQKNEIEKELGFNLTWHNPDGKNMCRIYTRQNANFLDETLWPQHFEWLRDKLERLHKTFSNRLKAIKVQGTSVEGHP